MSKAAYIGNFGFPDKNASGKRVFGNCRVLQRLGYRVICIGPGKGPVYEYEGVTLYSVDAGNGIQRVLRNKILDVESILEREEVDTVFLYGALFTQKENLKLISWCRKNGVDVYYDQVDWLDLNWHNPLRGIVRACNQLLLDRCVALRADGVICISTYLAEHYAKSGVKTAVIPPLSTEDVPRLDGYDDDDDRPVRLLYAGTTSDVRRPTSQWKDRIDIMLKALLEASNSPRARRCVLDVYGMTEDRYLMMFPKHEQSAAQQVLSQLGESVRFHGAASNRKIIEFTRMADFTMLVRDKKRSTMAGFPTKVSESIGCGTPVLCNDTSDIKNYVVDGKTGFVSDDVVGMLRRALSMSGREIKHMKLSCYDNPFSYLNYEGAMGQFLGWREQK